MKKILLLICFYSQLPAAKCQPSSYWQQQVNYTIDVSLNHADKSLDGHVKMQYYNNSPDTLYFIWFHLWPNAYKNDKTAFSDQLLENGRTDFYFSNNERRGYINRIDFKVNGITSKTADHPQQQDIIKLILPSALSPKTSINIETAFHVKLPDNFSRSGHIKESFQITQWYPKPAVYDKKGWHEMPYLDQGEFYSEFGNYDVSISLDKKFVVAATGVLKEEKDGEGSKTLHFQQDSVHDFAWFADKDFLVGHDTLQLASKIIDVYAYYHRSSEPLWKNAINYIKSAIKTKSNWVGEYPYKTVSVVESPSKSDGGMEYPTVTLVATPSNEKELDFLIYHEVGHNWFYGILASNERAHPWMDEGMNTYYDNRYSLQQYGNTDPGAIAANSSFIKNRMPDNLLHTLLQTVTAIKKDQPIETPSEKFNLINYNLVAYTKTGEWMKLLETELGLATFDNLMHEYYNRWQFKHPYPEDFKSLAEEVSGKNLDHIFGLLNTKGSLQKPVKKDIRVAAFFSMKNTDNHNYIFIAPAIGYNFYDKFMIGALLHNYTLPLTKFQFLITPLYATGSKKINGLGRMSYSWYPGSKGQKAEISIAASKFTADDFTDSTNSKNYLQFNKIVPSIKYVFANKDPKSTVRKFIQWKTILINETSLMFTRDTTRQIDVITYPVNHRYLNQLQFVIENYRKLYPYNATLQAEQGDGFLRFNFTGNYYFNYAHSGGLDLRFFAGKFIYTGDQTYLTQFQTDQYHLNMTGPKGYEDYTYSNYFVGRNEFEKFSSQQIMIRDGGFKVRTDYLSNKIGKTDNWLTALNFTTTIPKEINPLELIPVNIIRLKVFVDVGTYAEAWKKDAATGRFLYDAGLQLSLFNNLVTIYAPLLYSKVYKDYIKSTITEKRFVRNISFSIDLQQISLKRLFPQSPF
ncbi:MAG: M1 family metallopeptidase [Ferruginibacter sp.]